MAGGAQACPDCKNLKLFAKEVIKQLSGKKSRTKQQDLILAQAQKVITEPIKQD